LVGNNDDMYKNEKVTNKEGISFAKELNAIYQRISTKREVKDVDELFEKIGKKFFEEEEKLTVFEELNKYKLNKYINF
jgi:hypothetical protein